MFPDMYLQYNHPTSKSQQKPFDKNRQNLIPLHPPQRRCPHPPGTPQGNSAPATIQRSADSPHLPGAPQGNSAPATIQRSADSPHPPSTPQGNSAPAAIQRSADGSPPSRQTTTPHTLTPPKTERTDCQRGGCMVGTRCVGVSRWSYLAPGASDGKVLCGHKPQSKPHLSEPGTHQRTWRVMGRPARQKTQTLSMPRRNDRTRHDHAAAPLADCPFVPPPIPPSPPTQKKSPQVQTPRNSPKTQISNYHQSLPVVTNHHPTRNRNF